MSGYALWLADAARTTGFPVVEVPGWQTRGHCKFSSFQGVVGHHTGTAETAPGDYPSLRIVRDGRSDLPGPLCNYGLGRSGTIYVVAAGVAWHAGPSCFAGFTSLNDKFIGIEAESAGGGRWTAQQLDAYPKLVGAALRAMGQPASRYCSHRGCATPSGRKPDPKGIDDQWMRNRVAALLSSSLPSCEEDEMASVVLNLPAGMLQKQPIGVPPFVPFPPDHPQCARIYLSTGWEPAQIRAGYFIRDRGPGLSPQAEGWGGTGPFTLVPDDRPSWPLPEGCTQVSLEYDSQLPLAVVITYKPA